MIRKRLPVFALALVLPLAVPAFAETPLRSGNAVFVRFSKDGSKLTTITGFSGTEGPNGNLLIYPTTKEWDLAKESRPAQPGQ